MLHAESRTQGNSPALSLCGVRKAFADVIAVNGLDLEMARAECFGLLGPNGAGKTTTIEICEGLTAPDEGQVELLGLNWRNGAGELRQRIGVQLQETQFPEKLTVEEVLRLFRSFFRSGIPELFPARDFGGGIDPVGTTGREARRARGNALRRPTAAAGHGLRAGGRSRTALPG